MPKTVTNNIIYSRHYKEQKRVQEFNSSTPSMQFALATQTQLDRQGHRQTDTRARICFYDRQNYLEVEQLADAVGLEVNE